MKPNTVSEISHGEWSLQLNLAIKTVVGRYDRLVECYKWYSAMGHLEQLLSPPYNNSNSSLLELMQLDLVTLRSLLILQSATKIELPGSHYYSDGNGGFEYDVDKPGKPAKPSLQHGSGNFTAREYN